MALGWGLWEAPARFCFWTIFNVLSAVVNNFVDAVLEVDKNRALLMITICRMKPVSDVLAAS